MQVIPVTKIVGVQINLDVEEAIQLGYECERRMSPETPMMRDVCATLSKCEELMDAARELSNGTD